MFAINPSRFSVVSSLAGFFLLIIVPAAQAAFVFTGQNIDVTFQEPASLFPDEADSIVAGAANPDVGYLDGSNIGDNIMIDFESIDFADTSVTFILRGDGGAHGTPGYQTTGWSTGARYVLTMTSADFSIGNLTLAPLVDMTGVSVGSEVTFDAKNIYFDISTLGILERSGADIGSITMNVEFVPIPAALPLMLSGLAGLALVSYRRKVRR